MAINTKKRHLEILAAARQLLDETETDVTQPYEFLVLAKQLRDATQCHINTAKRNLGKAARIKRGEIVRTAWGGDRGGGRYKQKDNTVKSVNDLNRPMDCWQVAAYLFGQEAVDKNHLLAGEAARQMKAAGWTFVEYDEIYGEEVWQPPRRRKDEVDEKD